MILSKSNTRSFDTENFIESKILADQLESVLIVVPTNRKLRDLKKKLIRNYSQRPVSKINIETITTLTTKLLKENISFNLLSDAASTVLIKETAEELELSYFAAYSKGIPFGTLDKIKNVISEYKKHGIIPKLLEKEAEKLTGGEKNKALDIAAIYRLYLDKCKKLHSLEIGDIYNLILEQDIKTLKTNYQIVYPNVNSVFLDGFDDFTELEVRFLDLLSTINDSNLIINFDYYINNENLFSHLSDTFKLFTDKGFNIILDKTPLEESGFRNIVRSKLFKKNDATVNSYFSKNLVKAKTNNRVEEVEFIAKTIKLLLINEKIKPESICVSFNIVGNYSSIIRDIFSKYGIPINLTDRVLLKTSPPVIAAYSLLELVENDFYYHDLLRVLTNGFFNFDDVDLNNLIAVANDLKITKGLQNWEESIDDALSLLNFNTDIAESEKKHIAWKYRKAQKDILSLANLVSPFRRKLTRAEFISNFKKILLQLRLPCKVLKNSVDKEEEFIKSITVLLQTLNEVLNLIDTDEIDKKYSLQFFLDQLRAISNWARFNVKEKSDYGVLVTSVNEIRGLKFDYLFLGGMCDGDFPTRYSPEIFFSGSFLKKEQIHQTEERYHFYQALCSWNKKLFLTVPQKDSDTELVESTFMKDIQKLFLFTEIGCHSENHILSKEQLQISYAKNSDNKLLRDAINELNNNSEILSNKNEVRVKRKEDPFTEYNYSGFIGSEKIEIQNYLKQFGEREFSVSQFETFAKCPFKYFAERILKLEQLDEPTEEAEPIELGNVLHSILYDFYSKIINNKIKIGQVGTKEFSNLKKILFEIAEQKITKLNLNSPLAFFEKEKILGIDGQKENSILYKFLLTETESETDFIPKYFEFSFGNFSKDEDHKLVSALEIGDLKLRGKVDRIDIDEKNKLFNIIDYKLKGKKPTGQDLIDGISLQLPVYLMAGNHILKNIEQEDFDGINMTIYSLNFKDGNFGPNNISLSRKRNLEIEQIKNMNDELISNTKEKMSEYHQKIKSGKFNLSELDDREDKVCRYCDFRSFCRVQEVFEV